MKQNRMSGSFGRNRLALSVATALALNVAGLNLAQAQDEDEAGEVQEIQVTGSRISQRGNYTAPNPVTSLNSEDLQRLGITNMSDAMTQQISQNISNFQPGMTGDLMSLSSSFFVGATIANLRGLNDNSNFGSRTLTLVNGRRMVSSSNMSDVVDMNVIPSNMLARMDVVTGGASAAYGSGAMAGVVNMQLNTQMEGFSLDLDHGFTDENDGENSRAALSFGTSLFDGRGHFLIGGEWQDQNAIRSCADARDWCGEGNAMLTNNSSGGGFSGDPADPITPYPQYGNVPANFMATGMAYNQFSSNGVIPVISSPDALTGTRFTPDGTDIEEYNLGIRGGATGPGGSVINGDGPTRATNSGLNSGYERTSIYSHFEYDFTDSLQGYTDVSYATNEALNVQWPTQGWSCVKFDQPSVAGQAEQNLAPGDVVTWGDYLASPAMGAFLFNPANAIFNFATFSWTLLQPYTVPEIPGIPAVPGGPGDNAYLATLSDEAVAALVDSSLDRNGQGIMNGQGNAAQQGLGCGGHAGVYKVWGPQMVQTTERETDTATVTFGLKGSFGDTWTWDAYYQTGRTESTSTQLGAQTNWRYAFATDSIIDPRAGSPTFGQPVCRVTVEGVPATYPSGQLAGQPISPDVANLAEGCLPLNPFGTNTADQAALDYAFRPLVSTGENSLDILAFNSSGQVWEGWGAGPISMAVGAEMRWDEVDNAASDGESYERLDFPFPWSDAYGGKTTVYEGYLEVDVPLLSDLPLIDLLSINGAVRHAQYNNKGGAGTTGDEGTQETTNWKFSTTWQVTDWLRLRGTISQDLRAATYRELYIQQPSLADSSQQNNLWIINPTSSNGDRDNDMVTTAQVGNPNLKPESSDTFTVGFVFSPGGWAEGMNLSMDYYQIDVKDGIGSEFGSPIALCFEQSGNVRPTYDEDTEALIDPGINDQYDPDNKWCQLLAFGDPSNSVDPTNPYSNLTNVNSTYTNRAPFQTRGIDISWDYSFPVSAINPVFENIPGAIALRFTGTHALEASTTTESLNFFTQQVDSVYTDVVGQVGNGLGFTFGLPVQPTPEWAGNFSVTWFNGPASLTLSSRYVGKGKIDVANGYGPGEEYYQNDQGEFLAQSVDNNNVPSYFNWGLNGSYNLQLFGLEQFQVWGQINNLFDKEPLFSGGYVGGTNPMFYDTLGRSFKFGIRTRF